MLFLFFRVGKHFLWNISDDCSMLSVQNVLLIVFVRFSVPIVHMFIVTVEIRYP